MMTSKPRVLSLATLLLSILALASSGCSATPASGRPDANAKASQVDCPSIYIAPHARLNFSHPLAIAGTYELTVKADGKTENCTMTVSNIGGSVENGPVVSNPTTRAPTTCKAIDVSGITNAGHLAGFKTVGTPARLKLSMKRGETQVLQADLALTYAPTELLGRGCTKTKHASATLKIAGQ